MKIRTLLLTSLAMCAATSPVLATTPLTGGFANSTPYLGASIGLLRYSQSGLPTLSPSLIVFRAGVPLSRFFAIEARLGTGLSSDQADGNSLGLGTYWGIYAKGSLGLIPRFAVYGVAGLASVDFQRNFAGLDTTDTGVSVGVGGEFQLSPAWALDFGWTYLPSPTQADSNLLSFGVNYAL